MLVLQLGTSVTLRGSETAVFFKSGLVFTSVPTTRSWTSLLSVQVDESSRAQWQEEKTHLVQDHQNQLERLRSEYDSKLKEQRARMERDLGTRMNSELQKARSGWEKEQQNERWSQEIKSKIKNRLLYSSVTVFSAEH